MFYENRTNYQISERYYKSMGTLFSLGSATKHYILFIRNLETVFLHTVRGGASGGGMLHPSCF